jgi:transposase InsO family protein
MAIEEVVTAPRSPWQNAYVERIIGSIRRECLDCESACKKDPVSGVIGIQTGPHHEGLALASIVFGSRGLDVGRGDNRKDPTGVFQAG